MAKSVESTKIIQPMPPEWQIPPGVTRELWHDLADAEQARGYDKRIASTPLLRIDQAFVEKHCGRPGRLVDLGCGTGRLLIPLARRGYWVLGVDLAEEMLRIVGEKAEQAGVIVHRMKANLVDLASIGDGSFDYATCLFSTLGMVSGTNERRRMIEHASRLLRPGGTLVVHVHNYWFNFWDRAGRRWLLADILKWLLGRQGRGDRTMPRPGGSGGLTLHHFARREIVQLLRGCGLEIVEVKRVGLQTDGSLKAPWWFGWLRSYGYLVAARRR
jgi:2-polyprenyl-3-methyl-5-hydroxy-6-metoxy-1,4-benzoquinol methylase